MFVKIGFNPQTPQGGLLNASVLKSPPGDSGVNRFIFRPEATSDQKNYNKRDKCDIEFLGQKEMN
jgi:hypothetical protein